MSNASANSSHKCLKADSIRMVENPTLKSRRKDSKAACSGKKMLIRVISSKIQIPYHEIKTRVTTTWNMKVMDKYIYLT